MMFRATCSRLGLIVAVSLLASAAAAHHFWIEPSSFHPSANETLRLAIWIGDSFADRSEFARDSRHIERFVLVAPDGQEKPVVGLDGSRPAGLARLIQPGVHRVGYRSVRNFSQLDGPKFEAYLAQEGLEHISALRAQRGQTHQPGREAYSRCAKTVLETKTEAPAEESVSSSPGQPERPLGLRLEIVPEVNPCRLSAGDELPVRVLFDGQPLAGALVEAVSQSDASAAEKIRSDAEGRAVFHLNREGLWLVRCVWMVEAEEGLNADWESLWASLTLETRPREREVEDKKIE
jgi:uncharacterized GH25 family protein